VSETTIQIVKNIILIMVIPASSEIRTDSEFKIKHSDTPISKPFEDRLGYNEFSKRFGKIIAKSNSSSSVVIALTGEWGSGKSSVLNLTEYYLTEKPAEIGLLKDDISLILHFNPWIFSGRDDLIRQFFHQIRKEFGTDHTKNKLGVIYEKISPVINRLVVFGLAISQYIPKENITSAQTTLLSAGCINNVVSDVTTNSKKESQNLSLLEERQLLTNEFEKLPLKIVIVIDDIDRLTNDEILDFFKAIKAIIDFPNIVFILAYDEEVIQNAVGRMMCIDGNSKVDRNCARNYLEKIIQLPIPLPPPNKLKQEIFLGEELTEIFKNTHEIYKENEQWERINNSISHFVSTPRRIKRLINAIQILYPSMENEVNANDFICIETVRQFLPDVYYLIKNNPDYFIFKRRDGAFLLGVDKEEHKRFHEKWFNEIKNQDKKYALTIIANLFPEVLPSVPFHEIILTYDKRGKVRSARIHADKNIFQRYFRLEIDNFDYSIDEINTLFSNPFDSKQFTKMLESYSNKIDDLTKISKAGVFLHQLERYVEEYPQKITQDQIKAILSSFFDISDRLMVKSDLHQGAFGKFGNSRIIDLISTILMRMLDKNEIGFFLKTEFQRGNSLVYISLILADLDDNQKPERVMEPLISEEDLSELKKIFVERLENWTRINSDKKTYDFSIFKKPEIGFLLYMWTVFHPDIQKISNFAQNFVKNDDKFVNAIIESIPFENGLSIQTLQKYVSKKDQKQRIQNIIKKKTGLLPSQKSILKKFIEYEENPNFI
jgi:predicted KAP-like P-loop ATPase